MPRPGVATRLVGAKRVPSVVISSIRFPDASNVNTPLEDDTMLVGGFVMVIEDTNGGIPFVLITETVFPVFVIYTSGPTVEMNLAGEVPSVRVVWFMTVPDENVNESASPFNLDT